ncbi:MAG: GxxExxY protein [Alphaproteobacteria bacterium PRO2]|nr:GxxExxY protein [Alphaproteobacteria bacterium PRO2]
MQEPTERENKVAEKILDAAFIVHKELGPGLLESVYEVCFADILTEFGMNVSKQKIIPVPFRGKTLEMGFRADLLVEDCVLVELKAIEKLIPLHEAQMLTYLRLSKIKLGLLLNFNEKLLKNGIKRFISS